MPTRTPRLPTNTPTPTNTAVATATPSCGGGGDTGYLNPSANASDTGGWGDGFETDPPGAYTSRGGYAQDAFSIGDQHRYYNYHVDLPAGCTVAGIAVRLDWWLNYTWWWGTWMSVDLSWDGGTTWTATKTDNVQATTHCDPQWRRRHVGPCGSASDLSDANFRVRITMGGGVRSGLVAAGAGVWAPND